MSINPSLIAAAVIGLSGTNFGGGGSPKRKYKKNGEHLHIKESARRRKQMAKIAARTNPNPKETK